jgi:hypothetical protein
LPRIELSINGRDIPGGIAGLDRERVLSAASFEISGLENALLENGNGIAVPPSSE